MSIFTKNIYLFSVLFSITFYSSHAQVNVYDGFETAELNKIWSTDRMVRSALQMQSTVVRNGHSAASITLHTGDVHEEGSATSKPTERDELLEARNLVSWEDRTYEYQFSFFLPDSFPIVPTRLVIAQWKQDCPEGAICSDDSPVMAIRYVSGKLFITLQTDTLRNIIYQTKDEIRNQWLDFRFKVRFSRSDNGRVDAWLNEKQIISYKGSNCYSEKKGYENRSYFYFKMGLYRNVMPEPMTIYIDEYRKKEWIQ